MFANLRNFRKDRESEQPISIAFLQVNIRKFVNFAQGDVIQTLVTNLFRDNNDLLIITPTGLLSGFVSLQPLCNFFNLHPILCFLT